MPAPSASVETRLSMNGTPGRPYGSFAGKTSAGGGGSIAAVSFYFHIAGGMR
jgi:hypothetical protein